jgi:hypothetical protein
MKAKCINNVLDDDTLTLNKIYDAEIIISIHGIESEFIEIKCNDIGLKHNYFKDFFEISLLTEIRNDKINKLLE